MNKYPANNFDPVIQIDEVLQKVNIKGLAACIMQAASPLGRLNYLH